MATAKKIVLGDYMKTARERRARRGGNYIFDRRGCKFDEGNFLVGEMNTFLAVGWESLSHLQGVVSALKLIPLPNPNQAIFSVPQVMKNLSSPPRQTKTHGNSNMLHMFKNNTHADFRWANKHVLITSYVIQVI